MVGRTKLASSYIIQVIEDREDRSEKRKEHLHETCMQQLPDFDLALLNAYRSMYNLSEKTDEIKASLKQIRKLYYVE